jgi:hypothetical protein
MAAVMQRCRSLSQHGFKIHSGRLVCTAEKYLQLWLDCFVVPFIDRPNRGLLRLFKQLNPSLRTLSCDSSMHLKRFEAIEIVGRGTIDNVTSVDGLIEASNASEACFNGIYVLRNQDSWSIAERRLMNPDGFKLMFLFQHWNTCIVKW